MVLKMPEKTQQQKTKELKTFSAQVVTLDTIKNDKRKLTLLHIIKTLNSVSEKGLTHLINILREEKKVDLGYNIVKLGNRIIVRELSEDIKALLYVGLIETEPKSKKLQLTSKGKEFLEGLQVIDSKLNEILKTVEEQKSKIIAIDEEVSAVIQISQQSARRR
jgi:predicted transcriptional regulator